MLSNDQGQQPSAPDGKNTIEEGATTPRFSMIDRRRDHGNLSVQFDGKWTMTTLQAFIIAMGLTGQLLIARKDARGYLAWIVGNLALMVVFYQTQQFGLIAWQVANTAIQVMAFLSWLRESRLRDQNGATVG